jgi:hypothetical protein
VDQPLLGEAPPSQREALLGFPWIYSPVDFGPTPFFGISKNQIRRRPLLFLPRTTEAVLSAVKWQLID